MLKRGRGRIRYTYETSDLGRRRKKNIIESEICEKDCETGKERDSVGRKDRKKEEHRIQWETQRQGY